MVPVSLSLSNFLSYGEDVPALDFTGFHVACISGQNGHGKSALLDAITWALWGEARKSSSDRKPDDGLLRIGATEMKVVFEFELEGEHYRVARSYRKTRRTSAVSLELQVLDSEHPKYAKLDERQYHGSAYGMVPAKRGYLREAGKWNFQQVTVNGSTIRVELNGNVILDTDLNEVSEYMGNSPHPGKDRTSGYFGFAGHGDAVEFRNISIKPLPATK